MNKTAEEEINQLRDEIRQSKDRETKLRAHARKDAYHLLWGREIILFMVHILLFMVRE